MLIGLKKYTYKKEKVISIIVGIIFFMLATILYITLQQAGTNIANAELPLIYAVSKYGKAYTIIYGIVIVSAIYTSAVAAGYGFIQNCSKDQKSYKRICIFICVSAVAVSKIGFSYLVELLYPIFGLLGLVQIVYIFLANSKANI